MTMLGKSVIGCALVFSVCAIGLPISHRAAAQVAPAPAPSATLPDIFVPGSPDARGYSAYARPATPRPSAPHYQVPAGYDADVALHPYTSGIGPCTEGASPSQGCHHPTGQPIPPSHYERPPFTTR